MCGQGSSDGSKNTHNENGGASRKLDWWGDQETYRLCPTQQGDAKRIDAFPTHTVHSH